MQQLLMRVPQSFQWTLIDLQRCFFLFVAATVVTVVMENAFSSILSSKLETLVKLVK